ncbi:hypothetical protein KXJ72_09375 [Comamonas aquatica]|nr:hypothetical protein KXJ72_09375 [Comamonas aquatica]
MQADFEYGLVALNGGFALDGQAFVHDELAYLAPGRTQLALQLQAGTRLLLVGGTPFAEQVTMWWNFLGKDLGAIRGYRAQWEANDARFGTVEGGEHRRLAAPQLP